MPWSNLKGPWPVRSYENPRGLDRLTASERDRCILGNIFADFTRKAPLSCWSNWKTWDDWLNARSMWQRPSMEKIVKLLRVTTLALHQSTFGTEHTKPTRLLVLGVKHCQTSATLANLHWMLPGHTLAPGMPSMRDRATSGPFKTTGAEHWPIRMGQWIAAMLLDTCAVTATTAKEGQDADKLQEKEESCRRDLASNGEKDRPDTARRYQASRTSTTEAGSLRLKHGRKRLGS